MNLYYAMGGGLGHLTRAVAFLQTLGIENDSIILTASPFAEDYRVTGKIRTILLDKSFDKDHPHYQIFLQNLFGELKPKKIYLDSFPVGIIGEFARFNFDNSIEINYIARHLKWKNYSLLIGENIHQFEKTYLLEPLETKHQNFIEVNSKHIIDFELVYPSSDLSNEDAEIIQTIQTTKKPFWLIVHSGDDLEINELVEFTNEMREIEKSPANLVLISPKKFVSDVPNLVQVSIYPASVLFDEAQKIFTACGFNAMNQTRNFKDKHYFIPFDRRFDDQFWRAKLFKAD